MVARLFGKVPFRNETIWQPGHLLCRLNERDGLSGDAGTGGAVSHYQPDSTLAGTRPQKQTAKAAAQRHQKQVGEITQWRWYT